MGQVFVRASRRAKAYTRGQQQITRLTGLREKVWRRVNQGHSLTHRYKTPRRLGQMKELHRRLGNKIFDAKMKWR